MTGSELIHWILDNHAEDKLVKASWASYNGDEYGVDGIESIDADKDEIVLVLEQ